MTNFTITYHTAVDSLGRRHFTATWVDKCGDYRPQPHPIDGKPVGHRRAQCFHGDPEPIISRITDQGHTVTEVGR